MQPTVDIIQDNYTTRPLYNIKNTKQHELYYCHCHSLKTYTHAHTHSNNTNTNNTNNTNDNNIRSNLKVL